MTQRNTIKGWLDEGIEKGATHVIVMCDTFSYDNYPVYVMQGQNPRDVMPTGDMQRPVECYNLRKDIELQLNEYVACHWDI